MTIYIDMDGVLADFDRVAERLLGMPPAAYEARHGSAAFWSTLRRLAPDFDATLPEMPDARELWRGVRALAATEPVILTCGGTFIVHRSAAASLEELRGRLGAHEP